MFHVVHLGSSHEHDEVFTAVCEKLGFSYQHLDTIGALRHYLVDYSQSVVLIFCDHDPSQNQDAFLVRSELMEDFSDIPFLLRMNELARFEDMEKIIELRIKAIISHYRQDELTEYIKKFNRKDEIEMEDMIRKTFVLEANELLEVAESAILELEQHPSNVEALNQLFRNIHTIKGSCRIMRWKEFEAYTHEYEALLAQVDTGRVAVTPHIAGILLKGFDHMVELVEAISKEERINFDLKAWLAELNSYKSLPEDALAVMDTGDGREAARSTKVQGTRTIKVPVDALSQLTYYVTIMSELQEQLHNQVRELKQEFSQKRVDEIDAVITEIESIEKDMMDKLEEVRCVAVKSIFRPYPRIIRDLSRTLGKQVDLIIDGEETRIDNTIASILSNSLIHLIRNSIDHGIELPEVRKERGKYELGTIRIIASKNSEELQLVIEDDGNGIDVQKVGAIAVKKGLFPKGEIERMTDDEIMNIIFLPGFSTSDAVSAISGRGVGMDMVKSSVESVGGHIHVESQKGKGSRFKLKFSLKSSVIYF